ncbi:hypothetical protein LCGC14_2055350 [marine sediment metagenome]|uniref:Uncharacterized protein n=1 Tax=marine sediment metagenome TaxID=412755 RepID=A0A0F9HJS6_9ZZZZ
MFIEDISYWYQSVPPQTTFPSLHCSGCRCEQNKIDSCIHCYCLANTSPTLSTCCKCRSVCPSPYETIWRVVDGRGFIVDPGSPSEVVE